MKTNKKPADKKETGKVLTKEEKELIKKQHDDKKKKAFNKENILK